MSASIEASLRLEIAQYQQSLAKAKGDALKFKEDLKRNSANMSEAVMGKAGTGVASMRKEMDSLKTTSGKINLGGVAMQAQDIAVQLQMGTRASLVLAQQGSQILSSFGTAGAITGGVIAIGGALWTMKEKAAEAFQTLRAEVDGFDQSLSRAAAGGVSGMASAIGDMAARAKQLRAELKDNEESSSWWRSTKNFFSESKFDPTKNTWTNQRDEEMRLKGELAAKNEEARAKMLRDIVSLSGEETQIALLRAKGQEAEAEAMERKMKLAQEIKKIESMDVPDDVKKALTRDAKSRTAAEDSQARGKGYEQAFDKAVKDGKEAEAEAKKQREEKARQEQEARRVKDSRAAFQIENKIAAEQARSGVDDNATIRKFRDELNVLQLTAQVQEQLKVTQAEAVKIALQKVSAERAAADAIKAQVEAEKQKEQSRALQSLKEELAIGQALADGRDRLAEKLERERRIREDTLRIIKETGVAEAEARRLAEQKEKNRQDLADRGAVGGGAGNGERRKIVSRRDGSTKAKARYMGSEGGGGLWGENGFHAQQTSESAYDRLQKGKSAWQMLQERGRAAASPNAGNPLARKQEDNAARSSGQQQQFSLGREEVQLLVEMRDGILNLLA